MLDDDSVYRGGHSISGLQNSTAAWDNGPNDFSSVLPYGNTYIDASKLSWNKANNGNYIIDIPTGSPFKWIGGANYAGDAGVKAKNAAGEEIGVDTDPMGDKRGLAVDRSPVIAYVGKLNGYLDKLDDTTDDSNYYTKDSIEKGNQNVIQAAAGSYLYQITYLGAATLKDGTKGNLVITVDKVVIETTLTSNKAIVTVQGANSMSLSANVIDASGNRINELDYLVKTKAEVATAMAGNKEWDTQWNKNKSTRAGTGVIVDLGIKVTDAAGNPVKGTISYAASDMDFENYQDLWGRKITSDSRYMFNEALTIQSGALSYAVTPHYDHADGETVDVVAKKEGEETTATTTPGWIPVGAGETQLTSPLMITGAGSEGKPNGVRFSSTPIRVIRDKNGSFDNALFGSGDNMITSLGATIQASSRYVFKDLSQYDEYVAFAAIAGNSVVPKVYSVPDSVKRQLNDQDVNGDGNGDAWDSPAMTTENILKYLGAGSYTTQRNDSDKSNAAGQSFDTGFALLLDASGSKMQWSASNHNGGTVGTALFDTTIYTYVEQSHGTGGGTYLETYALEDECKVNRAEGTSTMSRGTEATVTVVPEDGYCVKTIMVGGAGLSDPSTYTVADLEFAADGEGRMLYTDVTKNVVIEDNGDGTYDVILPNMQNPRHVHVDFTADYYFYKVWKGEKEPTDLTMTATPFAFVFRDVTLPDGKYTIDGNTFTGPNGSYELENNTFTVGDNPETAVTYFLEGNSLVTYTTDPDTGVRTKDKTYPIRLDYVQNGSPVEFTVSKSDADDAAEPHVAESMEDGYTTWKITYPADGYETKNREDWPALAIETVPAAHNINHVERNYWFVTEESPGWSLVSYDNSKAEAPGKIDTAQIRKEVYKEGDAGDLSAWAAASTKDFSQAEAVIEAATDNDHAYMSVFNTKDNSNYSWGGKITNVPAVVVNVEKTWDDFNNEFKTRQDVWFHIDARVTEGDQVTEVKDILPPQKLSAEESDNKATFTWGDKALYGEGYLYEYSGYENTEVVGKASDIPHEDGSGNALYYVVDENNPHKYLPKLVNGMDGQGNPVYVDDPNGTTYYVNELADINGDAVKIDYYIRETDGNGTGLDASDATKFLTGYTTTIEDGGLAKEDSDPVEVDGIEVVSYTNKITNTLAKIDFTVTKIWDDGLEHKDLSADVDNLKSAFTLNENDVKAEDKDDLKFQPSTAEAYDPATKKGTLETKADTVDGKPAMVFIWHNIPAYVGDNSIADEPPTVREAVYSIVERQFDNYEEPAYSSQGKALNEGTVTNTQRPPVPKDDETWGKKGETQKGNPTFEKGTGDIEQVVMIDPVTGKPAESDTVDALDKDGKKIGTYTKNSDGSITFTPDDDFVGTPKPLELQAVDSIGRKSTATYHPHVYSADPMVTKDGQYDPDDKEGKTLKKHTVDAKDAFDLPNPVKSIKLIDPGTSEETDSVTVPGEGTYTIDENGVIIFTPEEGFTGKGKGVEVHAVDEKGYDSTTFYTPIVVPNKQTETLIREVEYRYVDDEGNEVTDMVTETYEFVRVGTYDPDKDDHPAEYGTADDPEDSGVIDMPDWTAISPKTPVSPDKSADGWKVKNAPEDLKGLTPDNAASMGFADDGTGRKVRHDTVYYEPLPPEGTPKETFGLVGQPQKTDAKKLFDITTKTTKKGEANKIEKIRLRDPDTGEAADTVTAYDIYGNPCGTFSIDENGIVTFKPDPEYAGVPEVKPALLIATDSNGLTATAEYTPHTVTDIDRFNYTRTVDYIYDNGEPVLGDDGKPLQVKQTVEFSREPERDEDGNVKVDDEGHIVWKEWTPTTESIDDVKSPVLSDGWYTDETIVDGADGITPGNASEKMIDVTVVYHKPPEGDEKKTFGGRGETQKGTPPFTEGSAKFTDFTLIDPKSGEPVDKIEIPGEGVYTVDPKTGEVTFVPDKDFVGTATKVTVRATDANGNTADGYYTPTVVDNKQEKDKVQKITYVYKSGEPVLDEDGNPLVKERTGHFERTGKVDPETGKVTWPAWTHVVLDKKDSPEIKGYTPDKDTISELKVSDPDSWPDDEVVTYSKKNPESYWVTYIDPATGRVIMEKTTEPWGADEPPAPDDPTRPGFDFDGWDKSVDPEGNITYTAKWKAQHYTLKYDANGGSGNMDSQFFTGEDEKALSRENAFTREGYNFAGFKAKLPDGTFIKGADGNEIVFTTVEDYMSYFRELGDGAEITLVAQWTPEDEPAKTYWVTYIDPATDRVIMDKTTVNVGDPEPEAPADPTREGYVFDGWDRSEDTDGNVTYTAKWVEEDTPTDPTETPTDPTEGTDEPTEPENKNPGTPARKKAPETGDKSSYTFWIAVAVAASAAGITTIVLGRGKKRRIRR